MQVAPSDPQPSTTAMSVYLVASIIHTLGLLHLIQCGRTLYLYVLGHCELQVPQALNSDQAWHFPWLVSVQIPCHFHRGRTQNHIWLGMHPQETLTSLAQCPDSGNSRMVPSHISTCTAEWTLAFQTQYINRLNTSVCHCLICVWYVPNMKQRGPTSP